MKKIRYFLEYALVRSVDIFFLMFPRAMSISLGAMMGAFFSWVLRSRNRLALANVQVSLPEKSAKEHRNIVFAMWQNLGRTAVEFVRASDIDRKNYQQYFHVQGREHVDEALRLGRGLILVTLHFGNWEMLASGFAHFFGGTAIARPMKNPLVERWVQGKRGTSGIEIILHRQAVKASLKILKQKKALGILVDQNLYTGGVFTDFFGRPAATTTLPSLLHDRTGAPIIIGYCLRENGKFRLVFEPSLSLPRLEDAQLRVLKHTQMISSELERIIRQQPESWFWIHNRWKRKQLT